MAKNKNNQEKNRTSKKKDKNVNLEVAEEITPKKVKK